MKRIWSGLKMTSLAAALAAGAILAGAAPEALAQTPEVRYGLQRGAMGALKQALPAAADKQGIKYDYKIFNDSTAVILAMEQKQLEMGNITAQHLVRAIDEGMNLVLVAGWGGGYNVLIQGPDMKLAKDDLAGFKKLVEERKAANKKLKIGVPTGSQQHLKLTYLLTGNGINPDRDVEVLNIPFPNLPRALDGREIDMAMSLAPFSAMAINGGSAKLFHHVYGEGTGKWEIGYAVRKDLVQQNPALVQKIVSSHVDALRTFVSDVDKQVELEMKESNFPKPVIDMTQRDFLRLTYRISVEDIKRTAKQMYEVGWAKKDHSADVEKYIDFSFLEKATGESKAQLMGF